MLLHNAFSNAHHPKRLRSPTLPFPPPYQHSATPPPPAVPDGAHSARLRWFQRADMAGGAEPAEPGGRNHELESSAKQAFRRCRAPPQ